MFLFPFHLVRKEEEIVILGAGGVGKDYIRQVSSLNYCTITCVMDYKKHGISIWGIPVIEPDEQFKAYTVVIAISNEQEAIKVKEELEKWGYTRIVYDIIELTEENGINGVLERKISDIYHEAKCSRIMLTSIETYLHSPQNLSSKDINHYRSIHKSLIVRKPKTNCKWCRVGKSYDGGYIMLDDFARTEKKIAYSFGINRDVSWDLDMAKRDYEVFMYDHTIDGLPLNNNRFHWYKCGLADSPDNVGKQMDSLENLVNKNGHNGCTHMILKMDVEGAEWGALLMVPDSILGLFDQIVLEMHGMLSETYSLKRIQALEKILKTHTPVHIHGNNAAKVANIHGCIFPMSLEVTYLSNAEYEFTEYEDDNCLLDIDQPNNPARMDVDLYGWNNYSI